MPVMFLAWMQLACPSEWAIVHARAATHDDSVAVAASLGTATPCARLASTYLRVLLLTPHSRDLDLRTELQRELDAIFRAFPREPRVFLALAFLRFQQGQTREAARMLSRAEDRLANGTPPLIPRERALMAYLRGRLAQDEWRDWRTFGRLRGMSQGQWYCDALEGQQVSIVTFNLICPEVFEQIMDDDFQSLADMKDDVRSRLDDDYREALRHDATFQPALLSLAAELIFERQWDLLDGLAASSPATPEVRLLRALAAYRMGRDSLAAERFSTTIAELPAAERRAFLDPEQIMSTAEARTFRELEPAAREQFGRAYWRSREVLFITDANERLLEHWARLTEADVVFGDPRIALRGRNTNVGELWIRYGQPLKIRDLAMDNGRGSFWSYGPDPDIVFRRYLTYSQYLIHEDAQGAFVQLRERAPQRYRPAELETVAPLAGHLARLRSVGGTTTDLLIAAPYPAGTRESLTLGVTVLDTLFQRIAQWRGNANEAEGFAIEVAALNDGPYNLVVEMLDQGSGRLYQFRDTLTTGFEGFAVSDLLILRDLRGPTTARSRRSLSMSYLYDLSMPSSDSTLTLYWEVYDPPVDSTGSARLAITVEVRDASRRPLLARVVRALGIARTGDTPLAVTSYEQVGQVFDHRVINWLTLAADWRRGAYEITVTIGSASKADPVRTTRTVVVR